MKSRSPFAACIVMLILIYGFFKVNAATNYVAVSEPQEAVSSNISSVSNKPMIMLASSKDHTLFSPIYTDYEDIDGDGIIDASFKPSYKYYGYFDSIKCYSYSKSDGRFNPDSMAVMQGNRFTCDAGKYLWSGNFLNWATMSRLDVVRKMLYGGKRKVDGVPTGEETVNGTTTVLERANLSKDSHSFVKSYFGSDIRDYTPFSPVDLIKNNGVNPGKYAGLTICNRSNVMGPGGDPVIRMVKGNYKMWSLVEGAVCSWQNENGSSFGPKAGRYFLDPDKGNGGVAHEQYPPFADKEGATYLDIGPEIFARVRVCDPLLLGEERCQAFPSDSGRNFKPYGIFQEFGLGSVENSAARAEFGVITGSYDKNLTAGALRKNISDFYDEINPSTGVFCHSPGAACASSVSGSRLTGNGAIKSFDNIQLVGRLDGQDYEGTNFQIASEMQDGVLSSWGNPVGEMVAQALRYFSGASSTNPNSTTIDKKNDLPVVEWKDPLSADDKQRVDLYGNSMCRPMYTIALSSSSLSFDENSGADFSVFPNKKMATLSDYVDALGVNEKLVGVDGERSVGAVDGGFGQNCTLKHINKLSDATGVCPEAPATKGTWQVAGNAFYSNTSKIRDLSKLSSIPKDLNKIKDALKVKTLAASLQGGVPRIEVPIPNTNPRKYVYITPESIWDYYGKILSGAILTFQSINSGERYGTFLVTWNDRAFGGDYDMDISGYLRYDVKDRSDGGFNIEITTDILNVASTLWGTHGYSVMGTDRDGRYLTHRHGNGIGGMGVEKGFMCNAPEMNNGTPSRCNVSSNGATVYDQNFLHVEVFKMQGVDNVLLQDPLWYAAKYGFPTSSKQDASGNYVDMTPSELMQEIRSNSASWDNLSADGSVGADGIPDGYFLARRPELLEAQLRKTFEDLVSSSNVAPAISTTVLSEGAMKYGLQFDSKAVSSQLEAYKLKANGDFSTAPSWEAGKLLQTKASTDHGNSRQIVTNDGGVGIPFRWDSLSAAYKSQMTTQSTNKLSVVNAQIALEYIRGDQSKEGPNDLRQRNASLLGPIVNSAPWVQQRPMAYWGGVSGYGDFYNLQRSRKSLLWVGANDGMLHAFNADTGEEVFGYVPGALSNRLAEIPLQRDLKTKLNRADFVSGIEVKPAGSVWPYVDGSPYSADVQIGSDWRTYVFASLGKGGRGVFALDATSVSNLSESRAADIFKWQFTAADDSDFGYQTGDIKIHLNSNQASPIARLNNGKFAMLLGNGQRSLTGKSALFILYMDGPDMTGGWSGRYQKIVVDDGTGNGLSAPRWEDLDGNGTADVVYAGDLKGNIWKFDLSSANASDWKPAFSEAATQGKAATPLFTALNENGVQRLAQPITTAPEIIYMAQGGVMVVAGTGNAFAAADFGVGAVQHSVYGVWDRGLPLSNAALMRRTYTRQGNGAVVSASASVMDWSKYQGWVMDLPGSGEAVLADASYDGGVLTFISTRPQVAGNQCNNQPANTLFTLDPISGLPERNTQGSITVDGSQVFVAGKDIGDPKVRMIHNRRPAPKVACKEGEPGCACTGGNCAKDAPVCGPGQRSISAVGRSADVSICYSMAPRLQWREISGLRTYP